MISEKLTAEVISELKRRHDVYVGFGLRYERLKAEHDLKELLLVCCPALIAAFERVSELEVALDEAQSDIRQCDHDDAWNGRDKVLKGGAK